jgi:hypothetical protein
VLTPADYRLLNDRWIDSLWADLAGIQRVDSFTGAQLVGADARKRDCSGLAIHYVMPDGLAEARGSLGGLCAIRVRRDNPELERNAKGELKQKGKYLSAPGSLNHIYFPPLISGAFLDDTQLPIILCESEFKSLALRRLASYGMQPPNGTIPPVRFVPLGLAGIWTWKGKIGKLPTAGGGTQNEKGPSPDFSFIKWMFRQVLIAFDADFRTNPGVRAARWNLAKYLMELGASVGFLEWPLEKDGKVAKGIDDWLARDGPEEVLEAIAKVEYRDGTDWRSRLLRHDSGKVKGHLENARIALSDAPEWHGTLHNDQFLGRLVCTHRPWSAADGIWRDEDSMHTACWLQQHGIDVGKEIAYYGAVTAARQTDIAKEWAEGLAQKWDAEPRMHSWLPNYMSVATTHDDRDISNYVSEVGRIWLLGGIGRLLEPGCQMDYTLVLCGGEGQKKSSALKILGRDWFTDSIKDISDREVLIELQGIWIVEFGELDAWRKGNWKGLRAFLTCRDDKFRSKYGHFWESHPRRCIFAGTTNDEWFLEGGSEGRRFLPVRCIAPVRLPELTRDVEQLWAEAASLWLAGERPDFRDPRIIQLASEEREAFKQDDPWFIEVQDHIAQHAGEEVTVNEILKGIGQEKARMTKIDQARVISCLKTLGYVPCQIGPRHRRRRGWRLAEVTVNGLAH